MQVIIKTDNGGELHFEGSISELKADVFRAFSQMEGNEKDSDPPAIMEQKQYFEAVPVSSGELPDKEGAIMAIHKTNPSTIGLWYKDVNSFKDTYTGDFEFTHWLRPVDPTSLIREKMAEAFDAGAKYERSLMSRDNNDFQTKTEYLNSIKLLSMAKNTVEGDNVIGAFMQWQHGGKYLVTGTELKYSTSWDWLLPVWKQIGRKMYEIRRSLSETEYNKAKVLTQHFMEALSEVDIKSAHLWIIEAITWYNQQ